MDISFLYRNEKTSLPFSGVYQSRVKSKFKKIVRDEEIKRELKMVSFSIPKVFHVSVH